MVNIIANLNNVNHSSVKHKTVMDRGKHLPVPSQKKAVIHVQSVWILPQFPTDRIDGVMVGVLASSSLDRGFEPRSGQIKDNTIGTCCFSAKLAALWRKSKDWLVSGATCLSADLFQ